MALRASGAGEKNPHNQTRVQSHCTPGGFRSMAPQEHVGVRVVETTKNTTKQKFWRRQRRALVEERGGCGQLVGDGLEP